MERYALWLTFVNLFQKLRYKFPKSQSRILSDYSNSLRSLSDCIDAFKQKQIHVKNVIENPTGKDWKGERKSFRKTNRALDKSLMSEIKYWTSGTQRLRKLIKKLSSYELPRITDTNLRNELSGLKDELADSDKRTEEFIKLLIRMSGQDLPDYASGLSARIISSQMQAGGFGDTKKSPDIDRVFLEKLNKLQALTNEFREKMPSRYQKYLTLAAKLKVIM